MKSKPNKTQKPSALGFFRKKWVFLNPENFGLLWELVQFGRELLHISGILSTLSLIDVVASTRGNNTNVFDLVATLTLTSRPSKRIQFVWRLN